MIDVWHRSTTLRRAREDYVEEGAQSVRLTAVAERRTVDYRCPRGHQFGVPFAADAEPPADWRCKWHGVDSPSAEPVEPIPALPAKKVNQFHTPRTHLDQLYDRRTVEQLEVLLAERLAALREASQRGIAPMGVTGWLNAKQGRRPAREARGPLRNGQYLS